MTTQTQQTAPATQTEQATHHYVLTLDMPGRASGSWRGTLTPAPGTTRQAVLTQLLDQIHTDHPEFSRANIVFFSLEPNQL